MSLLFTASSELVVAAFPGQQGPRPPLPGSVVWTAVWMFAVAVAVVAEPAWTAGRFNPKQSIGQGQRVHDGRIVRAPQSEPHELQEIRADQRVSRDQALAGMVAHRYQAAGRRLVGENRGGCGAHV